MTARTDSAVGDSARPLRSAAWFADEGKNGILARSWLRSEGLPDDSFVGRPVIGIANNWSELTLHHRELRRQSVFQHRGDQDAGSSAEAGRFRNCRAHRQPGAVRRSDQAVGRVTRTASAHRPGVVFDRLEDYLAVVDHDDLDIGAHDVIVIRYAGPRGYPGMPEIANVALPEKLLAQGVRDIVRISDARMSGTSYGTVVLHVSPEAALGGPLALVRTGDLIALDVPASSLDLLVDDAELSAR